MKKSNMTVLWLNKVLACMCTRTRTYTYTQKSLQHNNDENDPDMEDHTTVGPMARPVKNKRATEEIKENSKLHCDTDPLPNLCLVPLWKDVDVRLKRAGFDDSFVPGGHKTENY